MSIGGCQITHPVSTPQNHGVWKGQYSKLSSCDIKNGEKAMKFGKLNMESGTHPSMGQAYQSTASARPSGDAMIIISGALLVFVTLALISFNPADSSPFSYSYATLDGGVATPSNWCGVAGSLLASILVFFFGWVSYAVVGIGWLFLFLRLSKYKKTPSLRQIVAAIFVPWNLAVLAAITCGEFEPTLNARAAGGFLGQLSRDVVLNLLGRYGAYVLGFALLVIFMAALIDIAPTQLLGSLGQVLHKVARKLWLSFVKVLQAAWHVIYAVARALVGVLSFVFQSKKRNNGGDAGIGNDADGISVDMLYQVVPAAPVVRKLIISNAPRISPLIKGRTFKHLPSTVFANDIREIGLEIQKMNEVQFARPEEFSQDLSKNSAPKTFVSKTLESKKSSSWFKLPGADFFTHDRSPKKDTSELDKMCYERGKQLEDKLKHFGINGQVVSIKPGPVVTLFEYLPGIDVKISRIIAREDDLAMVLSAHSIRIVAPIPGTNVVGFEISNQDRHNVIAADLFTEDAWLKSTAHLPMLLGVDTVGVPQVGDLASMPHLLVSGSTGSGKSVCMHTLLISLLSSRSPDQLRLILIDPKRLEFSTYADIPHLLVPIVTDSRRADKALNWVVGEMERRYILMAEAGVRNITEYNKSCELGQFSQNAEALPFLVVMIDELADLMIVSGRELEIKLVRIAQMARAAGIHMIMATQRPSVDVVTGLIKVNFPSRISFRVSSKIDSRTIIDQSGAEKLLGRGDMLMMHASSATLKRMHAPYISEQQALALADYLRSMGKPEYVDLEDVVHAGSSDSDDEVDAPLYTEVLKLIEEIDDISISMLQRRMRIGFNRAARVIEKLEREGRLAPAQAGKPRKIIRSL